MSLPPRRRGRWGHVNDKPRYVHMCLLRGKDVLGRDRAKGAVAMVSLDRAALDWSVVIRWNLRSASRDVRDACRHALPTVRQSRQQPRLDRGTGARCNVSNVGYQILRGPASQGPALTGTTGTCCPWALAEQRAWNGRDQWEGVGLPGVNGAVDFNEIGPNIARLGQTRRHPQLGLSSRGVQLGGVAPSWLLLKPVC